jgi:hypothetical protein
MHRKPFLELRSQVRHLRGQPRGNILAHVCEQRAAMAFPNDVGIALEYEGRAAPCQIDAPSHLRALAREQELLASEHFKAGMFDGG